jgi:hypothetical protein
MVFSNGAKNGRVLKLPQRTFTLYVLMVGREEGKMLFDACRSMDRFDADLLFRGVWVDDMAEQGVSASSVKRLEKVPDILHSRVNNFHSREEK